jgi:phenylpropionate dioxygenase-like ring-hydroxylating dioxygenase large terminal subunit
MTVVSPDARALVREDSVHSSVYTDPAIFRLEMERLFARSWILVGHHSQIPNPGDFMTIRVGAAPVAIIRDENGMIRAFFNRCTHRGAQLCAGERGHTSVIACPYHGWTFALSGKLLTVPLPEEYPDGTPPAARHLQPVANVDTYRGFIFVNATEGGPGLIDFLGQARSSIDNLVDRAPADDLVALPTLVRHRYRGNWKLSFENLNDTIHAGVAHAASARAARKVASGIEFPETHLQLTMMIANGKPLSFLRGLEMMTDEFGHSFAGGHISLPFESETGDAYREALNESRGNTKTHEILSVDRHLTLLYPSSTWHSRYQTVRMVRPLAPNLTEVIGIMFQLKGAPAATLSPALDYCSAATSPLSPIITDDLEIYETIQRASEASPSWLSIGRGLNGPSRDGNNGSTATSEIYIRNQYRRWSQMLADS